MSVQIKGDTGDVVAVKGIYSGDVSIADKIVHTGDTDTVIRFPGSNQISFETNGTERMIIGSSGNITLNNELRIPNAIAHVGDNDTQIRFPANDTFTVETAGSERLRITSGGNFGIGTDNPSQKLHLYGSTSTLLKVENSDDGIAGISLANTGSSNWAIKNEDAHLRFEVAGNEKVRIESGGNVGIGTSNAATILHVQANAGDMLRLDRDNTGAVGNQVAFRHSASGTLTETGSINCVSTANAATGELRFSTKTSGGSNTEKVRILSSGGLTFNGDTATANALDDYEVGDWTPALSHGSPSYVTQKGLYTKIGELVLLTFYLDYSNGGTSTSQRLTGLPFAPDTSRETINSVSRLGSAFDEDASAGSRSMHSVSHTSASSTYCYVDIIIGNNTAGIRGTLMYRAV